MSTGLGSLASKPVRRVVATIGVTAACLMFGAGPSAAISSHAAAAAQKVWRYSVQVDGHGPMDEVVVRSIDLHTKYFVTGRYRVTVHLDGDRHLVSTTLQSDMYGSAVTPHTPYFGATNLDGRPGKELLFGQSSGANTNCFTALTYADGTLRRLDAPESGLTFCTAASAGNGFDGWRCVPGAIERRNASPGFDGAESTHFTLTVDTYRFTAGTWHQTRHHTTHIEASSPDTTSKRVVAFSQFDCPDLPAID